VRAHTRESQATMTPARALEYLREGNERFRANLRANRDLFQQVNETREGQFPFATILSCIDSRTSAELIFDQGFGDIFSIRIAGHRHQRGHPRLHGVLREDRRQRLVVVLGHTNCGAIKGACDHVQLGNLSTLLNKIQPSVYFERTDPREPHLEERRVRRARVEHPSAPLGGERDRAELRAPRDDRRRASSPRSARPTRSRAAKSSSSRTRTCAERSSTSTSTCPSASRSSPRAPPDTTPVGCSVNVVGSA
jgi:carbonic anhydrase